MSLGKRSAAKPPTNVAAKPRAKAVAKDVPKPDAGGYTLLAPPEHVELKCSRPFLGPGYGCDAAWNAWPRSLVGCVATCSHNRHFFLWCVALMWHGIHNHNSVARDIHQNRRDGSSVHATPFGGARGREVLEWPYTTGGGAPPPPLQTELTIVGKNEIYRWENLVGAFLVHKFLGPRPPSLLIHPWGGGWASDFVARTVREPTACIWGAWQGWVRACVVLAQTALGIGWVTCSGCWALRPRHPLPHEPRRCSAAVTQRQWHTEAAEKGPSQGGRPGLCLKGIGAKGAVPKRLPSGHRGCDSGWGGGSGMGMPLG